MRRQIAFNWPRCRHKFRTTTNSGLILAIWRETRVRLLLSIVLLVPKPRKVRFRRMKYQIGGIYAHLGMLLEEIGTSRAFKMRKRLNAMLPVEDPVEVGVVAVVDLRECAVRRFAESTSLRPGLHVRLDFRCRRRREGRLLKWRHC
jgi:hypothetical protein